MTMMLVVMLVFVALLLLQGFVSSHPHRGGGFPRHRFQLPVVASDVRPSSNLRVSDQQFLVQTQYGPVNGFTETTGPYQARAFYGIPYASPPVGDRRWTDPVPPTPWTAVRDATQFGAACPQLCEMPSYACPPFVDEDCLFLNVWSPLAHNASAGLLPVMFWIHGGHFEQGSGDGPLYDATALANTSSVVVVTINYRLGAFGFLYLESNPGNMGVRDQILALEWVQSNIQAFGGDPAQVTLFGESAGGTSVSSLLVSPEVIGRSPPLYRAAIVESNPMGLPIVNPDEGKALTQRVATDVGCSSYTNETCLRSVPMGVLLIMAAKAARYVDLHDIWDTFYPWAPTIGKLVPDEPLNLFLQGKAANVPIIFGTVEEEGRLFVYEAFDNSLGALEYGAIVTATFGLSSLEKILKFYPVKPFQDNRDTLCDLVTDYIFTCPARIAARSHAKVNGTYLYRFNHSFSFHGGWEKYTFCEGHVCHASELPFVFNVMYNGLFSFNQDEMDLARVMSAAWTSFASDAQPGLSQWGPLDPATPQAIVFATPLADALYSENVRQPYCDFWDQFGYHY